MLACAYTLWRAKLPIKWRFWLDRRLCACYSHALKEWQQKQRRKEDNLDEDEVPLCSKQTLPGLVMPTVVFFFTIPYDLFILMVSGNLNIAVRLFRLIPVIRAPALSPSQKCARTQVASAHWESSRAHLFTSRSVGGGTNSVCDDHPSKLANNAIPDRALDPPRTAGAGRDALDRVLLFSLRPPRW